MTKALIYIFIALSFLYFLFYPFLKNAVNRKKTFRWFIILYVIAMLLSTIQQYFFS